VRVTEILPRCGSVGGVSIKAKAALLSEPVAA
jgi:hypothetical protein